MGRFPFSQIFRFEILETLHDRVKWTVELENVSKWWKRNSG